MRFFFTAAYIIISGCVIIRAMKYNTVLLCICLSFFGCATVPKAERADIPLIQEKEGVPAAEPFTSEQNTIQSNGKPHTINVPCELLTNGTLFKGRIPPIIRDQGALNNLYSVLYGNSLKAPIIDFSKKTVVTAAAGPFNTGGYSVVPVSAIKTGTVVNIIFEVKSPAPTDMVTQAFTHPYAVVSVDTEADTEIFIEIKGNLKSEYDKLDF